MNAPRVDPMKEGTQSAMDFTKYTLGVAGAAIAFLLGSDVIRHADGLFWKAIMTIAVLGFGVSAIGGVLVLMEGTTNIANDQFDLRSPYIRMPGIVNFVGLAIGFLFSTIFVVGMIWLAGDHSTPVQIVKLIK